MTAANDSKRVHLLLSAGGVRCLSYIGALEQLRHKGYEFVGLSPAEIREAALGFDLSQLAGDVRWNAPHTREGREIMDAALASYTPI
jgi:hypothetical protein